MTESPIDSDRTSSIPIHRLTILSKHSSTPSFLKAHHTTP